MSDDHRRYLILEQGLGSGVVNLVLNGVIAWALFRHHSSVPLWGPESIAGDTFATCFLLPFLTCLIVTGLARREVARGRFAAPEWRRAAHPILGKLPAGRFRRGVVLGIAGFVVVAPLTVWALAAAGVQAMDFWPFVFAKAAYAGVLGALVTPVIALSALGDVESTEAR